MHISCAFVPLCLQVPYPTLSLIDLSSYLAPTQSTTVIAISRKLWCILDLSIVISSYRVEDFSCSIEQSTSDCTVSEQALLAPHMAVLLAAANIRALKLFDSASLQVFY
jgi:hypothetical protein